MNNLTSLVIEDLVDSDFDPKQHEAYAYITDRYKSLARGRVGCSFLRQLNSLNWKSIQNIVTNLKDENDKPEN